jgi:hypothetical protein
VGADTDFFLQVSYIQYVLLMKKHDFFFLAITPHNQIVLISPTATFLSHKFYPVPTFRRSNSLRLIVQVYIVKEWINETSTYVEVL